MMADEEDRLSALGDDILLHILYFTPSKEAASTSVLSRRWGSLWRFTGAVNLAVHIPDHRSRYNNNYEEAEEAFFCHRDAFVRAAEAALTGAAARISRLTIHLDAQNENLFHKFLHRTRDWNEKRDVIGALLSHPAARRVEELRLSVTDFGQMEWEVYHNRAVYALGSVPSSETLRELDLTRCGNMMLREPAVAFSRLVKLRMRFCVMDVTSLQSLIDAAPGLATVHLDSVLFRVPNDSRKSSPQHRMATTDYGSSWSSSKHHMATREETPTLCLRCLVVTKLVLAWCGLEVVRGAIWAIELEAPRLRYFRYKGRTRQFLLRTPAPDMLHVDLHFIPDDDPHTYDQSVEPTRRDFWYQSVS